MLGTVTFAECWQLVTRFLSELIVVCITDSKLDERVQRGVFRWFSEVIWICFQPRWKHSLQRPAHIHCNTNKAIIDYTSPALCTPITPFPPIGDAAYHQHARGLSHGHRQHAQKFGKDHACGSRDILADRQTDKQTHRETCSSQYFATAPAGEVTIQTCIQNLVTTSSLSSFILILITIIFIYSLY